jgi:outer membrane protein assembly factor BamB
VRPDDRPTSFHGDPLLTDHLLVIGTDGWIPGNRLNHVFAFALEDGSIHWKTPLEGGVVSDIVRAGNRILAITRTDSLLCLELGTGRRRWSFAADENAPEESFLYRSPAVVGDRVFVGDMEGRVHALSVDSGRLLWTRSLNATISTGILPIGPDLVLADAQGIAHRISQATGEVRDTIHVGGVFEGPPVAAPESSVVLAGDREIACLDLATARVRWTRSLPLSSSRPYLRFGEVLAATTRGELLAFRVSDGLPRWAREVAGTIRGIGHDDQTLFLGTQEGTVSAFRRGKPAPGLGGRPPASPATNDRRP